MINYLLDPFIQIENKNGLPVIGAKIYVYYTGSRTVAPIYSDKEGTSLVNPAITDTLGNVTIFAQTGSFYDVLVYDNDDTLLFSKINVTPSDSTSADVKEVDIEAGFGIQVHKHYQGNKAIYNVSIDTDEAATKDDLAEKQDKMTAGNNIEITNDNTVNVVNRKELIIQSPLRINRTNDRVKLYLDSDYANEFKTKQTPVEFGGTSGSYISSISQNENGEIEATVQETVLPSFDDIHAGDNITITRNGNDLTISSKDWTDDITSAISGKLDTSIFTSYSATHANDDNTPYTAGSNISISNHVVSGKDWTSTINNSISGKLDTSVFNTFTATTNSWDVIPYTAGDNISISNHVVSGKDWTDDITSAISGKLDTSVFNTFTATTNSWDVIPYTAGDNIVINGHKISCTGDFSTYTPGSNIDIQNNKVSLTNNVELVDQGRLKIQNKTADKGSIVDASGFYVSNLTQNKYTDISKDYVHISNTTDSKFATFDTTNISLNNSGNSVFLSTQTNPSFGLHCNVSGAEKSKIDASVKDHQYARERANIKIIDYPDSTHTNTLTLDTTDVKLIESVTNGTNKFYSLKDACTPYTGGTGISVSNHKISCTGDITPYTGGNCISVNNHKISLDNSFIAHYRAPKVVSCNKDGTRYTIYSQGAGITDLYTFSTLYNTSTQKYELELSNDNHRGFDVYIDGVFVDYVASRKKIYETSDTKKPIKIELVGAGAGNDTPLYKFTVIFGTNVGGYTVSLYIEYDYNFIINI